jgi:hypothetical protein
MSVEDVLHEAMLELYRRAKKELNYNATYLLNMVANEGGRETARYLLDTKEPSDGYVVLWENGRLDLSVEAEVLKPGWHELFQVAMRSFMQPPSAFGRPGGAVDEVPSVSQCTSTHEVLATASVSRRRSHRGRSVRYRSWVSQSTSEGQKKATQRGARSRVAFPPAPQSHSFAISDFAPTTLW